MNAKQFAEHIAEWGKGRTFGSVERGELYPEQLVWSKVVTDGYETRKDALTRFLHTDHPFRTSDENATWDSMLHNMRDFAVFG